jgi:hypothetical protein
MLGEALERLYEHGTDAVEHTHLRTTRDEKRNEVLLLLDVLDEVAVESMIIKLNSTHVFKYMKGDIGDNSRYGNTPSYWIGDHWVDHIAQMICEGMDMFMGSDAAFFPQEIVREIRNKLIGKIYKWRDEEHLYNLVDDPSESFNLADNANHASVLNTFRLRSNQIKAALPPQPDWRLMPREDDVLSRTVKEFEGRTYHTTSVADDDNVDSYDQYDVIKDLVDSYKRRIAIGLLCFVAIAFMLVLSSLASLHKRATKNKVE